MLIHLSDFHFYIIFSLVESNGEVTRAELLTSTEDSSVLNQGN